LLKLTPPNEAAEEKTEEQLGFLETNHQYVNRDATADVARRMEDWTQSGLRRRKPVGLFPNSAAKSRSREGIDIMDMDLGID
jgi:hypothetical protein